MEQQKMFELQLPKPKTSPVEWVAIKSPGSVVIVGGNGAGKTRLGALLDQQGSPQSSLTHRVAAQRALAMPEECRPTSVEEALAVLRYGHRLGSGNKRAHRWGGNPETHLLNDYDSVMTYLFADDWEVSTRYRQDSRCSSTRVVPPETKLDAVKRIWEETLPYRSLFIRGGKVEAALRGDGAAHYAGSAMSDGERVIIYLIGQALSAPQNGIVIVDEPEIHLHKAIQARLWDNIEAERPDCLFVYLTHDVDFAASRLGATKLCFLDYDGSAWDWGKLPSDCALPEEVLLRIVGSRKPVLFVEGERTSLDFQIFQHVYRNYSVTPRGSCEDVIHSTATFSALRELHRLECCGIVDRDLRSEGEVDHLRSLNVHVLPVAEVENLFLTEDVLRIVASRLAFRNVDERVTGVKAQVLGILRQEKERLVSAVVAHEVERRLRHFDMAAVGISCLRASVDSLFGGIDIASLWEQAANHVDRIVADQDYPEAIKVFSNKGLLPAVACDFGHKGRDFRRLLARMVSSTDSGELIQALRTHLPVLA